jgi:molecular chaperone GrpE (heat shock protein)
MKKQTAMQELKSDLLTAIDTCNESLEEIKDLRIREACQSVVTITIENVLNRINVELLQKEREQIIKAHFHGVIHMFDNPNTASDQYYTETFNP